MSPDLATLDRPRGSRRRMNTIPWEVVIGIVLALLVTGPLVRGPRFVSRVTIENPSPHTITVSATTKAHDGWTVVGIAGARTSTSFRDVVDQGGTWVFRASGSVGPAVEFEVARAALERSGWRVNIPDEVERQLRAAGASPDPGL
ncbi:MAG TPA: hypothetical protein VFA83_16125 [Acidimicrobiales bacterium]|nr:hypothetical protein [Acidimicrobiales bacterium]